MREARGRYASCANPVQMAAMEITALDKTTTRMAEAAAEVSGRSSERRTGSDVVLSVAVFVLLLLLMTATLCERHARLETGARL